MVAVSVHFVLDISSAFEVPSLNAKDMEESYGDVI
jgi:hypothetical protein